MGLNPLYSEIPENPNLVALTEKFLDRIHSNAVPILKRELETRNIVLTERLLTSLSRHVNVKYQEKIVLWVLDMHETGRFNDAKTLKYTSRPNGTNFLEDVEKAYHRGEFRKKPWWQTMYKVPGYEGQSVQEVIGKIGELAVLKRLAGATIVKMGREATVRRSPQKSGWFKSYFTEIAFKMNDKFEELAEAVAMKEAESIIKKTMENRDK